VFIFDENLNKAGIFFPEREERNLQKILMGGTQRGYAGTLLKELHCDRSIYTAIPSSGSNPAGT
jgi:hypothetical protein